jgi:outer membrane protein insertion porin family
MVDASITENNFMGRGQIVQIKGSIAQYQRQALFSFTEPFLFNRELSGGFDVSYTQYQYSKLGGYGYDRDSFMVSGRLGWRLTDHWTQTMRLSAAFDQNSDPQQGSGMVHARLYSLGTNFRYYNLDTNFEQNTHTGLVGNLGTTYTGFGGTTTYMRYYGDLTAMVKFLDDRWQLKTVIEGGYIQSLDDNYIPRVYRYFLGGESLRGFDVAGVRRINKNSYSLGGLWKVNGSTQLNFPVFIPDEYQVKGFVFTDYGILGEPDIPANHPEQDYLKDMGAGWRTSAGFGIYWNTPMGPMNFSWGWPLKIDKNDRERRFLLSFETQF